MRAPFHLLYLLRATGDMHDFRQDITKNYLPRSLYRGVIFKYFQITIHVNKRDHSGLSGCSIRTHTELFYSSMSNYIKSDDSSTVCGMCTWVYVLTGRYLKPWVGKHSLKPVVQQNLALVCLYSLESLSSGSNKKKHIHKIMRGSSTEGPAGRRDTCALRRHTKRKGV